ncbi:LuxR C-terminal-related transcriptional regulator [Ralstonia sp. 1138]|uniref:helix-turn-helix transcriptional regulator n=1 Tax=Ralstonia sp. 1138 TaxID=3156423 RepID=UPI0033943DEB
MAHGMLVAGEITITHWQAHGHDARYLEQQALTFELEKRGALSWWLTNRQPFVIDPDCPPPYATEFEVNEIREFDLQNVAAHGILNLKANAGTYFSFAGVSTPLSDWHLDALRVLAPVLNDLYLAQLADFDTVSKVMRDLTLRQREIARRVVAGHSDKAIARELGVSPQTVKNQLSAVYQRLGLQRRSQLIELLR